MKWYWIFGFALALPWVIYIILRALWDTRKKKPIASEEDYWESYWREKWEDDW